MVNLSFVIYFQLQKIIRCKALWFGKEIKMKYFVFCIVYMYFHDLDQVSNPSGTPVV